VLEPPDVVTTTGPVPTPGGATAVIVVGDMMAKVGAGIPLKLTAVAPLKPVPVIVTVFPPDSDPDAGESPVTMGAAM
jgi:hypothetical protein